jgi:hypothetical protein
MPAVKKGAEELEKEFHDAVEAFKHDIEADGVSQVSILTSPEQSGKITLTHYTRGLENLPSLQTLVTTAQEWRKSLDGKLTVTVHVRKGSEYRKVIETG